MVWQSSEIVASVYTFAIMQCDLIMEIALHCDVADLKSLV